MNGFAQGWAFFITVKGVEPLFSNTLAAKNSPRGANSSPDVVNTFKGVIDSSCFSHQFMSLLTRE